MKIIASEKLESTGYRSLFEYVQKEGIEPALGLFENIEEISRKEF